MDIVLLTCLSICIGRTFSELYPPGHQQSENQKLQSNSNLSSGTIKLSLYLFMNLRTVAIAISYIFIPTMLCRMYAAEIAVGLQFLHNCNVMCWTSSEATKQLSPLGWE